ncbi:hypothetical protein [Catalinimonas niigatensis]|uniref:hypothetical protein n=1 Tax=Catalinimonas niigatensis TaxID=1397264 RepID=UPI0026671189|nr:hypothetical protein [Catalinimonas niigatensis]WPP52289.1 hypothetical protein PZB72_07840 [Catalinimonas niigatensis]
MRNLFRSYKTKEDLKAIADAKPKGVHHTVRIKSSYNETWEHIWSEAKKIGLSDRESRRFVSEERFSYDTTLRTKQRVEKSTSTSESQINQYDVIQWEESELELVARNEKNCQSNPGKAEIKLKAEQVYLDSAERETPELTHMAEDELKEEHAQLQEISVQESKVYFLEKKDIPSDVYINVLNARPNEQRRKETAYPQGEDNHISITLPPYNSPLISMQEKRIDKDLMDKEEENILRPLLYQTERLQLDDDDKEHQKQGIELEYIS